MYSPRPGFLYAVAVASIAFSVVSCSGETAGLPQADEVVGQSSVQSSSASPRYSIDEPLDVTPFLGSPCQLVSPGVLKKFDYQPEDGDENLPESDEMAAEGGPYCDWQGGDEGTLSVAIDSGNTERGLGGLENMRTLHEQGRFNLWEETTVSGYPAAYVDMQDKRSEGNCSLSVGVADDMTFSVNASFYYENPEEACRVVDEVAADVIQNLRGKN